MGVVASVSSTYSFPLISGAHVSRIVIRRLISILNTCRRACGYGFWMADSLLLCDDHRCVDGGTRVLNAVREPHNTYENLTHRSWKFSHLHSTSAGLYYFSAKLAPPKYAALASWITGWANVTGQVTLVCSIDFTWCGYMSSDPSDAKRELTTSAVLK